MPTAPSRAQASQADGEIKPVFLRLVTNALHQVGRPGVAVGSFGDLANRELAALLGTRTADLFSASWSFGRRVHRVALRCTG
jgi:hypothetical protein